jgi:predicted amidohydrolase
MSLQDWFLARAVSTILAYKSRPGSIRRALSRRQYARAAVPSRDSVMVGVVQMQLDLLDDGVAFANKYFDLVHQAVERGAQLIVFPEYAWLPILGLLPSVREIAEKGIPLQDAVDKLSPGGGLTIEGVFRTVAPAVQRIFETTASELAARFGVYLMPGSAMIADRQGRLFNTAYLFGPDGALIGTQRKLHPTLLEVDWMTTGDDLSVFALPFGKVAMPVCMDFTYWETTRVAVLRGADILLSFSAEEKGNELYMAMRGVASRIQESYAYGAQAYCVTKLFGLDFCGPSNVVAPLGVWDDATVVMAQTKTHDQEEVITAKLDLAHLRKWRAAHPRDYNTALYRKYLPKGYSEYRARVTQEGRRKV